MNVSDVLREMRGLARPGGAEGMARFGIRPQRPVLGVTLPDLRKLAKRLGTSQALADDLWATGIHEARLLATIVADPAAITSDRLDEWAAELDSWDVVDNFAGNLVRATPFAEAKVRQWAADEREFVRRAGFALLACLAHDRTRPDSCFEEALPLIREHAHDGRNFVKKAVNWALRDIGKRNPALRTQAIAMAETIYADGTPAGRWIARDALRELQSDALEARMAARLTRTS